MSKKKARKKERREKERRSSSFSQGGDLSSRGDEYITQKMSSEGNQRSISHFSRSAQDEERRKRVDEGSTSTKNINISEYHSRKDREYKKAVYRLGTATQSEKYHKKDVGDGLSKSGNERKGPTAFETNSHQTTSGDLSVSLSEELKNKRIRLVKRRSGEAYASGTKRGLYPSEAMSSKEEKRLSLSQELESKRLKLTKRSGETYASGTKRGLCLSEAMSSKEEKRLSLAQELESERLKLTKRSGETYASGTKRGLCPSEGLSNKDAQWLSLSQELELKKLRLIKRRFREDNASDSGSKARVSQGKSTWDSSKIPEKQPKALKATATSETGSHVSKLNAKRQCENPDNLKPEIGHGEKPLSRPFSFKIPKKTNIVAGFSKSWQQSLYKYEGDHIAAKSAPKASEGGSIASKFALSNKRAPKETVKQSRGIISVPQCGRITGPLEGLKEALTVRPDEEKERDTLSSISTCSKVVETQVLSEVSDSCDNEEKMLVEELQLARSQKRLEVKVVESYGELTCMDIDPPVEVTASSSNKEHIQQGFLIILDTNILLSHLDFVKKMQSYGLGALGFPKILIPWVVMQELDALKNGKLCTDVAHRARPAVHYIYTSLKNQEPRLWGQSMQQAAQAIYGQNAESNDDRVLQCCLQYQSLYPGVTLLLCTNDKNLCSKALLSGVRALSKADLVSEVERLKPETLARSHQTPRVSWPAETVAVRNHNQNQNESDAARSLAVAEDREVSTCVSVLEETLQGALSQVLETEMRIAYDDLWQEIVFLKPPWTLGDLLQCFKKHWIAVFGSLVQRKLLHSVEYLSDFFCKGKAVDRCSAQLALQEARELLRAFGRRFDYGGRLPQALSELEPLLRDPSEPDRVPQENPKDSTAAGSDGDTVMAEEEGPPEPQPSPQEVWAVFETIWSNVCQMSSAVFTALQFVPGSVETSAPREGLHPPEGAICCLHKLTATLRQLLDAFERVLSSNSCYEEVESLLTFIRTSEIASMKQRLTAKDLFECLSQQEYREKLRVGGSQLAELGLSLEHCASAVDSQAGSSPWL